MNGKRATPPAAANGTPNGKHAPAVPPVEVRPVVAAPEATENRASAVSDSNIRVDVGLLDKLMTLVGELVLARNQIVQYSGSQEDAGFLGTVQRLNLLTTELQAGVMKTRMQPIGNVWAKFPRVVRDLALACGKLVRLDMEGQETELDRTIIEAIRDPLTHIVRNSVDHGIEPPASRTARGKSSEGPTTTPRRLPAAGRGRDDAEPGRVVPTRREHQGRVPRVSEVGVILVLWHRHSCLCCPAHRQECLCHKRKHKRHRP